MATDFVEELQAYVTFLGSLWGILGSISVLFPLSNTFFRILPIAPPAETPWLGPKLLDPPLISAFATLACLYVIFYSFGQRTELQGGNRTGIQSRASRSFGIGILSVFLYLADFYVVPNFVQEGALIPPTDPVLFVYDLTLVVFYSGFFVFLTRAFVLLGLLEYLDVD
jgi:hypothetical protein